MLCVDDFIRYKLIRFLKNNSDAATKLRKLVVEHIAPAGLKIDNLDGGGEFGDHFQSLL